MFTIIAALFLAGISVAFFAYELGNMLADTDEREVAEECGEWE